MGHEREVEYWKRREAEQTTSREKENGTENMLLKIVNSNIVLQISVDLFSCEGRMEDKTTH